MATIIGVHGISQQHLGRHQLKDLWSPAIRDALERATGDRTGPIDMDIVFYGDLFLPSHRGADGIAFKGDGPAEGLFDDVDEQEASDLLEAAHEVVSEQDIAAEATAPTKGRTRVPLPLQAVFGAVGRRFGSAAAVLFFGDLRQVRRYLRDETVRTEVDRRISETMAGGCRVLLAHSLGSVAAFSYLCRHPERKLPLLVTMGSPLGLKLVRRYLPRPIGQAPGASPPQVQQWTNVYDRRDPVACAAPLRQWWSAVDDVVVENGSEAHLATRYLSKRATGMAIAAALARQP